jgi:hypothetical protein
MLKTEIRDVHHGDLEICTPHQVNTRYCDLWKCTTLEGAQNCPDGALSAILGNRRETTTIGLTVHVLTIKYDE